MVEKYRSNVGKMVIGFVGWGEFAEGHKRNGCKNNCGRHGVVYPLCIKLRLNKRSERAKIPTDLHTLYPPWSGSNQDWRFPHQFGGTSQSKANQSKANRLSDSGEFDRGGRIERTQSIGNQEGNEAYSTPFFFLLTQSIPLYLNVIIAECTVAAQESHAFNFCLCNQ